MDCNRFIKGTDILNPTVNIEWFTMEMMENVLDDRMVNNIRAINFTGTYGESSLHPQFFDFLNMIADRVPHKVKLMMETNGSTQKPEWWDKFGQIVKERFRHDSFVVFALDGIDNETHQKYRRGLSFDKIITNAKAFSKHAHTVWQMIEFEHNKHQFDEARSMAESFGWHFKKRRSRLRFVSHKGGGVVKAQKGYEAAETKRKRLSTETVQTAKTDFEKAEKVYSKIDENYADTTCIECEWKKKRQISIDYDGLVWQCCYFSTFNHPVYELFQKGMNPDHAIMTTQRNENLTWYENQYKFDWNNLKTNKLSDILEHRFFTHDLPRSFESRTDDEEFPRIKRCSKFCGEASREIESLVNGN